MMFKQKLMLHKSVVLVSTHATACHVRSRMPYNALSVTRSGVPQFCVLSKQVFRQYVTRHADLTKRVISWTKNSGTSWNAVAACSCGWVYSPVMSTTAATITTATTTTTYYYRFCCCCYYYHQHHYYYYCYCNYY